MVGSRPVNSGMSPYSNRSVGFTREFRRSRIFWLSALRRRDEAVAVRLRLDDLVEADERAAADEQDVGGVDEDARRAASPARPP